jgi:hypothetical protein
MNRTTFLALVLGWVLLSQGNQSLAGRFRIKDTLEKVTIYYKWKKEGLFRRDALPQLVLKIRNSNPHKVLVSFRVDYYWNTILSVSSQRMGYCVKPGRSLRGKMWDLVFSSGRFNREQVVDDRFLWEITDLEIKHRADCITKLNIRMKPAIQELEPSTK